MVDKRIPIYFINRNRLSALRRCIQWLIDLGYTNISVIDNASRYPPLLEYYRAMAPRVKVHFMTENYGPWVFWERGFGAGMNQKYIVSDSDLIPCDFCPNDLIEKMGALLDEHQGIVKVGPALRIDDLPQANSKADLVFKWESEFWSSPVGDNLFAAPIDTTFAMYRPGLDFSKSGGNNIRIGYPYIFLHTPWYVDEANLDGEERYYRSSRAEEFSYWSGGCLTRTLEGQKRIVNWGSRKKILHLACGDNYIPGWVNVDDIGWKLDYQVAWGDVRKFCLPFPDDYFDGAYVGARFCRIRYTQTIMSELLRVCHNGAIVNMRLPYFTASSSLHRDYQRLYCESSFDRGGYEIRGGNVKPGQWIRSGTTLVINDIYGQIKNTLTIRDLHSKWNLVKEMYIQLIPQKGSNNVKINKDIVVQNSSLICPVFQTSEALL